MNSHLIVGGPLHGSLLRQYDKSDEQWRWVDHDLGLYRGHRMHVEFSPADDASCSIAKVVQSDEKPKLPVANWKWLEESAPGDSTSTQRVATYAKAMREASESLVERSEHPDLADWVVSHRSLFVVDELNSQIAALRDAELELSKQVRWDSTLAPAILDGNGVDEFLLVRGNSSSPKEPVARRFLEAFHCSASPSQNPTSQQNGCGSGRLDLASKMLESPLASRVAVNRIWHHLFGRGIVPSVDNFGVLGIPPSNPQLLDHLATRFVNEGWSTKALIRSLVLSTTYRMSSHPTEADSIDPNNELWHRMPIRRLEGEIIRDSLLAVSGRLDPTPFGPSIPVHLTEFMQGRGRPGSSGPLDGNGRRSIYIAVRRNFLSPMMMAFDTPSPFSTVGRRTVSNVPAQALILMNDPFVIAQANLWAERILAEPSKTPEQRVDSLYVTAFSRHPSHSEMSEAISFLNANGVDRPADQREAWNNLCHVMVNVKEFVFIE